jgi:hypothetical protein
MALRIGEGQLGYNVLACLNILTYCWVKSFNTPLELDQGKESKYKAGSRHRFERATPCLLITVSLDVGRHSCPSSKILVYSIENITELFNLTPLGCSPTQHSVVRGGKRW